MNNISYSVQNQLEDQTFTGSPRSIFVKKSCGFFLQNDDGEKMTLLNSKVKPPWNYPKPETNSQLNAPENRPNLFAPRLVTLIF